VRATLLLLLTANALASAENESNALLKRASAAQEKESEAGTVEPETIFLRVGISRIPTHHVTEAIIEGQRHLMVIDTGVTCDSRGGPQATNRRGGRMSVRQLRPDAFQ
jgi:hypothetical protein